MTGLVRDKPDVSLLNGICTEQFKITGELKNNTSAK